MVNRKDKKLGEDQAIIVTEGKFVYVSIDSKGKPIKIE
jgi:acyl-CoA hydrolase